MNRPPSAIVSSAGPPAAAVAGREPPPAPRHPYWSRQLELARAQLRREVALGRAEIQAALARSKNE